MTTSTETGVIVGVLVGTVVLMYIASKSFKRVRHAECMVLERFGSYLTTLKPGVHWLIPFVDTPRQVHWRYMNQQSVIKISTDRIDMREHVIDCNSQTVITLDNVMVDIDSVLYFRITDAQRAVYCIQNLPDAIELLTQATLRDIIASLALDDTFSSREDINDRLLSKIQLDCERWGVIITRIELFNITPPADIQNAMENQIKSERTRRSTVLEADGDRESAIIKSRGDAAQMVIQAEGQRASTVLRAEGAASARRMLAEAEAQALSDIRLAVSRFGIRGVDYLTASRYLATLSTLSKSVSLEAVLVPTKDMANIGKLAALNGGPGIGGR